MDPGIAQVLGRIPCGRFVLTAAHDQTRSGALVHWVQRCAAEPPLVVAALSPALPVAPLIRDSRMFALCQICDDDRFLVRKFSGVPEPGEDPFMSMPTHSAPGGSPILGRALCWLECEVVRHIDLEADHGLYVGLARDGGMLRRGEPAVILRADR